LEGNKICLKNPDELKKINERHDIASNENARFCTKSMGKNTSVF
jgi:hypothetical protein